MGKRPKTTVNENERRAYARVRKETPSALACIENTPSRDLEYDQDYQYYNQQKMSYGQKPGAWARPPGAGQSQQLNPNLFTNQLGLAAAAQPFGGMPAMSLGSSLNALVNQAAFSNMNSVLAQAQAAQRAQQFIPQNMPAQQSRQASPPANRTQKSFVGTVTKLMETYGFVDEDVFFQTSVIRGPLPRVGDRVMVEASYNPSMPFKWNAYRIVLNSEANSQHIQPQQQQPVQQQQSQRGGQQHGAAGGRWTANERPSPRDEPYQARAAPERYRQPPQPVRRPSPPPARRSPVRHPPRGPTPRKSPVRKVSPVRVKEPIKRERERSLNRESREPVRTRSPTITKAIESVESSRVREAHRGRDTVSPPRRRQRIIPRYQCYVPKTLVPALVLKYMELRKRYTSLYIPSDFTSCEMSWLKSIQLDSPITFSPHPITYTVLHKDIDLPQEDGSTFDLQAAENPPDANSQYIVKVLLPGHPGLSTLRHKAWGLLADGSIDESVETQSIFKNIQFLVGVRGKNELMCIGGPWSPSLDGENPTDPQTLVNTSVRTTRAMVGVDLSACPKWFKMVHLHYYRAERQRIDSIVLMMPDVSATPGLMPTAEAFNVVLERIKAQLASKQAAIDAEPFPESEALEKAKAELESAINPNKEPETTQPANGDAAVTDAPSDAAEKTQSIKTNGVTQPDATEPSATAAVEETEVDKSKDSSTLEADSGDKQKKTPWSELNIKTMKVAELREELEARGLDSKGVKNALVQRLQDALDKEKAEEGDTKPSAEHEIMEIKDEIVEPMETSESEKPAEEPVTAEDLVEKPDDAPVNEKPEKDVKELEKEVKELEKAREKFEKEKKERKSTLERHYVLPKEPTVLVFPSKTAKSGKFECKVSNIANLLEYHQGDNKEASFEVFLFAEAFRESIDRANAFAVYHAMESALSRENERKRREEALNAIETPVAETATVENGETTKMDANEQGDKQQPSTAEKSKEEEDEITIISEKKAPTPDPRTKFKALINNVDLFSSFAHFDENVCGHIDDRDMETILFSLGLDLSRGDVQRLIKKLSSRDRINYRNLTDKWVDKDGNVKYLPTPAPESRSIADLASGHCIMEGTVKERSVEPALGTTPDVTDTGVVFYKGTVLNIAQSQEHAKQVETERNASMLKNEELELQLKTVKEQRDYLEKKKRRLDDDLDRYKKKLHECEKSLKTSRDDNVLMKTGLQDCKRYGERVISLVDKIFPPPKKEEKITEEAATNSQQKGEQSLSKENAHKDVAENSTEQRTNEIETIGMEEVYEVDTVEAGADEDQQVTGVNGNDTETADKGSEKQTNADQKVAAEIKTQ